MARLTCDGLLRGVDLLGGILVAHGHVAISVGSASSRALLALGWGHNNSHFVVAILGTLLALGLAGVLHFGIFVNAVLHGLLAVAVGSLAGHGAPLLDSVRKRGAGKRAVLNAAKRVEWQGVSGDGGDGKARLVMQTRRRAYGIRLARQAASAWAAGWWSPRCGEEKTGELLAAGAELLGRS